MTYIEFFDKNSVENICACLTHKPDKVIFLGVGRNKMKRHIERYKKVFQERGIDIEFVEPKAVTQNNLQTMVDILTEIVEDNDDCVFGLTGGEDLHLVAVGIVYERYKDTKNIQMHRFNLKNNTIIDCDQDGNTIYEGLSPSLTAQENIRIYGGDIIYEYEKSGTTFPWEYTDDFLSDIDEMWKICGRDTRSWNSYVGVLAKAETFKGEFDPMLFTDISYSAVAHYLNSLEIRRESLQAFVKKLYDKGLIADYSFENNRFYISYKNEQVKKCLTKSGQVLEMKITSLFLRDIDENGDLMFNDVVNGVYIDWDGEIADNWERPDICNEIDVLAMRHTIPVFVSCKNGKVDINELYKLSSVAERFGGSYAQMMLIATGLPEKDRNKLEYLFERAEGMGIKVLDNLRYDLYSLSDSEIITLINRRLGL